MEFVTLQSSIALPSASITVFMQGRYVGRFPFRWELSSSQKTVENKRGSWISKSTPFFTSSIDIRFGPGDCLFGSEAISEILFSGKR